jgi:hypothetical protein
MPETAAHLAERLNNEGMKTLAFFKELTTEQWEQPVYGGESSVEQDGRLVWGVHQILAHIVSSEESFERLIADIAAGGSGAPPDFNIDTFNQKEVIGLQDRSSLELLSRFAELRLANTRFVAQLKEEDLVKIGRHPFLGMAPLLDIIKLVYRHDQLHLRDIRRALAGPSTVLTQ